MSRIETQAAASAEADFQPGCIMCELPADKFFVLDENELCLALHDNYPVSEGHCLIIPRRHAPTYFDMTMAEVEAATRLLQASRQRLLRADDGISGFNIGMNCGKSAGQSVFHAHIHLIPRRLGDVERPQGGIRNIFPEKARYPGQGEG